MIFIVNQDPFGAVQLQKQLKNTNDQFVEIYLAAEEAEQNLYKLPELILLDENLGFGDLLYLTQSIKAYDASIHIVWLCSESSSELQKMYPSYGVTQCITKGEYFLERLSLTIFESRKTMSRSKHHQKRIEHLRNNQLNQSLDSPLEPAQFVHAKIGSANRVQ